LRAVGDALPNTRSVLRQLAALLKAAGARNVKFDKVLF
jgi:hypothetical protein